MTRTRLEPAGEPFVWSPHGDVSLRLTPATRTEGDGQPEPGHLLEVWRALDGEAWSYQRTFVPATVPGVTGG